jgi:hypothetical protein
MFPQPFFSKISPGKRGKKWAAYLDKYLLFPKRMKNKLQKPFQSGRFDSYYRSFELSLLTSIKKDFSSKENYHLS